MARNQATRGLPKRTGKASSKAKRQRSGWRREKKKDRRVEKSSHGKFKSVAELEAHRKSVS